MYAYPLLDVYERLKEQGQAEEKPSRWPIPVCKDGRWGLVLPDGSGTVVCPYKYDLLFREPYTEYVKYIALLDGKYGIVDSPDGKEWKEVVPCVMDCIYERQDTDGFLPLLKDGKWGIYTDWCYYIEPKFDELRIQSEDWVRARIGDTWGWVTIDGDLTDNEEEACYGSWANEDQ